VARSLRSGATLRQALAEVAPTLGGRLGDDLRLVLAEAEAGLPLMAALDGWPRRCPTPGVRLTAAALALSVDAGGAAALAVDGVAATLRANLAVAGEVRAQSSQARLSGLVIALAPLAFGALAAGTDRRTATFLLRTPFGQACLVVGLALDAVAAWWMHRITEAT
jgi:tight adherence protein B